LFKQLSPPPNFFPSFFCLVFLSELYDFPSDSLFFPPLFFFMLLLLPLSSGPDSLYYAFFFSSVFLFFFLPFWSIHLFGMVRALARTAPFCLGVFLFRDPSYFFFCLSHPTSLDSFLRDVFDVPPRKPPFFLWITTFNFFSPFPLLFGIIFPPGSLTSSNDGDSFKRYKTLPPKRPSRVFFFPLPYPFLCCLFY